MACADIFLGVLAIIFPPIPVWIKRGICSCDSLLNILLSILGYIPGLLHAWYIIARFPDPEYEAVPQDEIAAERGQNDRVTYYYVSREPAPHSPSLGTGAPDGGTAHRQLQRGGSNYGTLNQGVAGSQGAHGEGSAEASDLTPPTYAEAVKGDHKIQSD